MRSKHVSLKGPLGIAILLVLITPLIWMMTTAWNLPIDFGTQEVVEQVTELLRWLCGALYYLLLIIYVLYRTIWDNTNRKWFEMFIISHTQYRVVRISVDSEYAYYRVEKRETFPIGWGRWKLPSTVIKTDPKNSQYTSGDYVLDTEHEAEEVIRRVVKYDEDYRHLLMAMYGRGIKQTRVGEE